MFRLTVNEQILIATALLSLAIGVTVHHLRHSRKPLHSAMTAVNGRDTDGQN
jgi:hypothetical protein